MSKITFYPLIIVLTITCIGFYFLYSQKVQLATDVDLLKDQMDILKKENRDLNLRIRALEDGSLKNITQKATKTLQKTLDTMLNAIDQKVEEARRLNTELPNQTNIPDETQQSQTTTTPTE